VTKLGDTAQLTVAAWFLPGVRLPGGVVAARRRNTVTDAVGMGVALIFLSMPSSGSALSSSSFSPSVALAPRVARLFQRA